MNRDVFLSLLALDAYDRVYGQRQPVACAAWNAASY